MQNKAPQGKKEPSPTPERELEQYGVWVKAEPQDVTEEPAINRKTLGSASSGDTDAVLLTEEEEGILDSFELPDDLGEIVESSDTPTSMDIDEDLEEFESLDAQDDEEGLSNPDILDLDESVIEESVIDIPLDELDYEEPAVKARPEPDKRESAPSAASSRDEFSMTEVNIDDFGFSDDDSVASGPSLESMSTSKIVEQSIDSFETGSEQPKDEFESIDIDLQFDDTIPSTDAMESADSSLDHGDNDFDMSSDFESVDIDSIGLETPPEARVARPEPAPIAVKRPPEDMSSFGDDSISLDSFIDEDDGSSNGVVPRMELENVSIDDSPSSFDDVRAVSDDLSSSRGEPSSDLLQKIALELSSIKEELVSLRSQLSSLKASGSERTEPELVEESGGEQAAGGFFDDEDDDTIALTGDELDNILNTADFTEEAASDESVDEAEAPLLEVPEGIELLPEDGIYSAPSGQGIETIDLPTVEPIVEEFEAIDIENGITPLTMEPEDTSFLDRETVEDDIELDDISFEDVPLVEPNPSDLDIIVDSAFGNEDEELPVFEQIDDDKETVSKASSTDVVEPELVLDIDGDEEAVISTVDSYAEPIEEIDEALDLEEYSSGENLGGLTLHSEEPAVLEEIEEEVDTLVEELDDEALLNPSEPVQNHPDDMPNSLDDSLFVESAIAVEDFDEPVVETEEAIEAESIDDIFGEEHALEEEVPPAPSHKKSEPAPKAEPVAKAPPSANQDVPSVEHDVPDKLTHDVKSVLLYLDQLLASLPEEKIEEFASSEYYDTYKRLFDDLGLL